MRRRQSSPRHRRPNGAMRGVLATAIIIVLMASAPTASSCGLHDPKRFVSGLLNWAYPNALYVRTAVWMAEDAGLLPPRRSQPVRESFALQRITSRMGVLSKLLNAAISETDDLHPFSIVLIDSVLWTRFVRSNDRYRAQVHVIGPAPGDVVIVSHRKVVDALARGRLTANAAYRHGLIRLYGTNEATAAVANILETALTRNSQDER